MPQIHFIIYNEIVLLAAILLYIMKIIIHFVPVERSTVFKDWILQDRQ
jgi:hypothetical protein